MKSIAVLAAVCSSAAAFAPQGPAASSTSSSSALMAASPFANEIGAQVPLGYWDPLGICADGNRENFDRLRYVEIKVCSTLECSIFFWRWSYLWFGNCSATLVFQLTKKSCSSILTSTSFFVYICSTAALPCSPSLDTSPPPPASASPGPRTSPPDSTPGVPSPSRFGSRCSSPGRPWR